MESSASHLHETLPGGIRDIWIFHKLSPAKRDTSQHIATAGFANKGDIRRKDLKCNGPAGRGRQVIAVCKSADLLLMVLDASKPNAHRDILTRELESVGIRLNRPPPAISLKKRKTGGIHFNSTVPLTHLDEKMVHRILQVSPISPHHSIEHSLNHVSASDLAKIRQLGLARCALTEGQSSTFSTLFTQGFLRI